MTMNQPNIEQIQRAVASSLHEHWKMFLVEGIVLVVLGLIAIVLPPIARWQSKFSSAGCF